MLVGNGAEGTSSRLGGCARKWVGEARGINARSAAQNAGARKLYTGKDRDS